jgi:copper chaperone CopZ
MSDPQSFQATGLTCGHCVHAVTQEMTALDGVTEVTVDLVNGGASTVRVVAERALTSAEIEAALDEAGGYQLVG